MPQGHRVPTDNNSCPGRNRHKKCSEEYPVCQRCASSGRRCQWPTSEELTDRRHLTRRPRLLSPSPASQSQSPEAVRSQLSPKAFSPTSLKLCLLSESTALQASSRDLQSVLSRHFIDRYLDLILLPNRHPKFYNAWVTEFQAPMKPQSGLQYSMLACATSHLYLIDPSPRMQELALRYYFYAIQGISNDLTIASRLENDNGLLLSIILLYLDGVGLWNNGGPGSFAHVPLACDFANWHSGP